MQDLLAAVAQRWRDQRVEPGPPASIKDVAEFEARYQVSLPVDMRAYFMTLNGSADGSNGPMDDLLIAFWHLSEVRPLSDEFPAKLPDSHDYFGFADHSIFVHVYAVRITRDEHNPGPVFVLYDDVLVPIARSFRTFLEGYVTNDQEMLFPDPSPEWVAKYRDRAV